MRWKRLSVQAERDERSIASSLEAMTGASRWWFRKRHPRGTGNSPEWKCAENRQRCEADS